MEKRTKIFFDMEFTKLSLDTKIISIGLVDEKHTKVFYAEFTDHGFVLDENDEQTKWMQENVMDNLLLKNKETFFDSKLVNDVELVYVKNTADKVSTLLLEWLQEFGEVEMWSDCLSYDWVLFNSLFGKTALDLPKFIYYIPFDLCTVFKLKGIDPDISREEFCNVTEEVKHSKHNALYDALVIRSCYHKVMGITEEVKESI